MSQINLQPADVQLIMCCCASHLRLPKFGFKIRIQKETFIRLKNPKPPMTVHAHDKQNFVLELTWVVDIFKTK